MKKLILFCMCLMVVGASCKKKDIKTAEDVLDIIEIVTPVTRDLIKYIPITADVKDKDDVVVARYDSTTPEIKKDVEYCKYIVGSWAEDGECLSLIADKMYGDAFLWPLLLEVNGDNCPHQDLVYEGDIILIPILED